MNRILRLLDHAAFMMAVLMMGTFSVEAVQAQPINVTFRAIPPYDVHGISLPGDFNGWNNGTATAMTYVDSLDQWIRTQTFLVGTTTEYKFFVYRDSPTSGFWTNDENNPLTNPNDNDNSILVVTDPMVFEMAEQTNDSGLVTHFSAGVFGSGPLISLSLRIAGADPIDALSFFDPSSRILHMELAAPLVSGTRFEVNAVSSAGTASASIGSFSDPISWQSVERKTTGTTARLRAIIRSASGAVDPAATTARVTRNGELVGNYDIDNGQLDQVVDLLPGENEFVLTATVDGSEQSSSGLTITSRASGLQNRLFDISITGSGYAFDVLVTDTENSSGGASVTFTPDVQLSTTTLSASTSGATTFSGSVSGAGEFFVDIEYTASDGSSEKARAAIVAADDGSIDSYEWAEKASWIDQAVVYEVFPLTFGPTAEGVVGAEGNRFNEIASNLSYIRDMGFNTIWFMPIMHNVSMSGLGAGYNIIDFKTVDPKLGTNDDFRMLVDRAHELGIRVILDLTVNHSSPDHPWVESLRNDGDYAGYLQTTPNSHSRGLDGRGASLPEQWDGSQLYRVYDGFGDLANLNWDNDDLQADMLEIIRYWLTEFKVDGYRFDAYWGPWRKFGPNRFGVPIREVMRRYRPDAWSLGELEGTGSGTEVYYADNDNGTSVAGGLDSAYDWEFSGYVSQFGNYNRQLDYRTRITANGFNPGPNSRYFRFLENHDWTRIQSLFSGNPNRIRPLTSMLMTIPGIPMIYQGQEVGYGGGSGDTRRLPVDWNQPENDIWAERHRFLATARARFPAFGSQDINFMSMPPSTMGFVRPFQDQNAVVVINFSGGEKTMTIDPSDDVLMSIDGPIPYYDLAADTSGSHLGAFDVTLPGYGVAIFVTQDNAALNLGPLPALPYGAVYTANEDEISLADEVVLDQNYPNPSSGRTTIAFNQPRPAEARLEVFDMLGRRVAMLLDQYVPAGSHSIGFDTRSLRNGTYFYRLTTDRIQISRSMTILR